MNGAKHKDIIVITNHSKDFLQIVIEANKITKNISPP